MLQLGMVKFTANSYILIEGTPATDRFFIIQSGKCRSYITTGIPGHNQNTVLGPGDFIGVVSCMTGFSQNQNVIAMTEVTVIAVRKDQYPDLIVQSTPVAMKIVHSFAQSTRFLNSSVASITTKSDVEDNKDHIFNVAQYYDEIGLSDIAYYCYYQYLKENPDAPNKDACQKKIDTFKMRSHAVYLDPVPDPVRSYPRDAMIFCEDQHGSDMFIIQDGQVKISKIVGGKEVVYSILTKGAMFGEMALLENSPRSASAIAMTPVKLMTVNKANFEQMITTQPQMIARLTSTLAERIWVLYRQIISTAFKDPRERLVDSLALMIEKSRQPMVKGTPFPTNMTPAEFVSFVGFPDEEKQNAMNKLMMDQNAKVINGKVVVPDMVNCVKQAAFYRKQMQRQLGNE